MVHTYDDCHCEDVAHMLHIQKEPTYNPCTTDKHVCVSGWGMGPMTNDVPLSVLWLLRCVMLLYVVGTVTMQPIPGIHVMHT